MAHATAVSASPSALVRELHDGAGREVLYKADRPRAIDRYIDFFGDGVERAGVDDRCGELFLESLA